MTEKENKIRDVLIVIPAYEPDDSFEQICKELNKNLLIPLIVVDDGSGKRYKNIFKSIESQGNVVLRHSVNLGKGRALKTAFNYVLNNYENCIGVVTADSDGQHRSRDIVSIKKALANRTDVLVLGVRDFEGEEIPWKSKFGNKLTRVICNYLCGVKVTDTQTGLRGISKEFMKTLMNTPGEGFEFETNMLIATKDKVEIIEVPIETVYDSRENHRTHFDPIKDSVRIYKIFGIIFTKFVVASVSSFFIDILLFSQFCGLMRGIMPLYYISIATILARVLSSFYNFAVNYGVVFKSQKKKLASASRYFTLVIVLMGLSALFTTVGAMIFQSLSETVIKVIVDTFLFFLSYKIQQRIVF